MDQIWKKVYSDEKTLLYEGFTVDGKPFGAGKTFFENGSIYQEGIFDVKGLVYGREYYPNGNLRFEGTFEINHAYGPNFPRYGKCYDKDGYLYFDGELSINRGGVGNPMVREPEEYGPVVQTHPKIEYFIPEPVHIGRVIPKRSLRRI